MENFLWGKEKNSNILTISAHKNLATNLAVGYGLGSKGIVLRCVAVCNRWCQSIAPNIWRTWTSWVHMSGRVFSPSPTAMIASPATRMYAIWLLKIIVRLTWTARLIISANGTNWIGGDYEIGPSVRVSVCLSVCVHDNSTSNNAGYYINLPPLHRSGASFCLPFRQERWCPPVKTSTLAEIYTLTSAF